jgi:pyruvate ferredoxin oxidoreductase beta subunit
MSERRKLPKFVTPEELLAPGHRFCPGCGEAIAIRQISKATGENVIIVSVTGCIEICTSALPQTSWQVPWIHTLFENAGSVVSGIEAAYKARNRKYGLGKEDVRFVAFAGDGGTSDIGIQALSGAMERFHDFLYCCFDNEAYMNTGVQRSSATPYGAWTTTAPSGKISIGQKTWKKNMPEIAAAHSIPYVATTCPSYYADLMRKVKKGLETEGPAYIHILAVCPTGWRIPSDFSIELGRLAVRTGIFPLYEVENGVYRLNRPTGELIPVREYLEPQGRFRHLPEEEVEKIQRRVIEEHEKLMRKCEL